MPDEKDAPDRFVWNEEDVTISPPGDDDDGNEEPANVAAEDPTPEPRE